MKRLAIIIMAVFIVNLVGCAGMTDTQQRTVTGGLGGAGAGALIGAMAGNAGLGAVIGAAAGSAGGFLFSKHKEAERRAYEQGLREGQTQRQK